MAPEHPHHRPAPAAQPGDERTAGGGPLASLHPRRHAGTRGVGLRLGRSTLIALLAVFLLAGVAYAGIPDSGGVIHGCYVNYNNLPHVVRVIDPAAGQTCTSQETAITWNQTGTQGIQGPKGDTGAIGPAGPLGMDFSGQSLAGKIGPEANLPFANLNHADGTGLDLSYVNVYGAALTGATLTGATLTGATLINASLPSASLINATLINANLSGAFLNCANLNGANLNGANLTNTTLTGAELAAFLDGTNLGRANLTGADLSSAALNGTNLGGANLSEANLSGANLKNVIWIHTICPDGTFSDTNGTSPQSCIGHGGGL